MKKMLYERATIMCFASAFFSVIAIDCNPSNVNRIAHSKSNEARYCGCDDNGCYDGDDNDEDEEMKFIQPLCQLQRYMRSIFFSLVFFCFPHSHMAPIPCAYIQVIFSSLSSTIVLYCFIFVALD